MKIISINAIPEAEVKRLMKSGDYTYNIKLQYLHMEDIDVDDLKYVDKLKEIGLKNDEAIAKLVDLKPTHPELIRELLIEYGEGDIDIDKIIKIFSK
ncbi:MAG: hypothetical protein QXL02_02455 [Candidatus Anstonellales archaeon]